MIPAGEVDRGRAWVPSKSRWRPASVREGLPSSSVDIVLILVVILIFVLAVRGPAMLPRLGQALGRGIKDARKEIPSALRDDPADPDDQPRA